MQGANDQVSGGVSASDSSSVTPKEEIVDQKIRCPCGCTVKTELLIQVFFSAFSFVHRLCSLSFRM